jgi:hypothetical protein
MPAAIIFARSGVEICAVCGRRARTARQIEHRLRFFFLIERRQHDDV